MSNSSVQLKDTTGASTLQKSAFGELKVVNAEAKILLHFPYNINTERVATVTTGSGTVTQSNFQANLNTTAASSSTAKLITKEVVEYLPGSGVDARFTAVFTTGVAGSEQILGIGNDTDGFFIGYNGASFGLMTRNNTSDTWVAQSAFNLDTLDGSGPSGVTIDPTKGNVYRITFQWLGYGAITYFIEHPVSGSFIPVHRVEYANANTAPSLSNPSLPMMGKVTNTTNDTAITIKTASLSAYSDAKETGAGSVVFGQSSTKSVTTENSVITLQNKATYQSVANQVRVRPTFLSLSSDGNKNVTVNLYINTTLGGVPSYTDVSANTSVCSYDVAGTTISGGRKVGSFALGKIENETIPLKDFGIVINPGDLFTVAATSAQTNEVTASLIWSELFR